MNYRAHPLFGATPARMARWYAATLLIVILLALATHLSMQQQSAAQVNRLMQQLAKEHGWKLGEARLHMLRGALTLRELDITQDALHLRVPYVLLRGHFSDQLEETRLTEVHMQHGTVVWFLGDTGVVDTDFLFNPLSALTGTWHDLFVSVRVLILDGMKLHLQSTDDVSLTIERIHIESDGSATERRWFASSQSSLGMFQWRAMPNMIRFDWQHIDADKILSFLQPAAPTMQTQADLQGHIIWQNNKLSGSMDWRTKKEDGRLAWQGQQQGDDPLNITLHAMNWPLKAIPTGLPVLQHCLWQGGRLTGTAHIKYQPEQWDISSKVLNITQASSVNTAGNTCIQAESLELKDILWQWPQHHISMGKATIQHGQWHLPMHFSPLSQQPWKITQAKLDFSDMRFHYGKIELVDVYGNAEIRGDEWRLEAHHKTIHPKPWTLQLSSPSPPLEKQQLFTFKAFGKSFPPTLFRYLLPARLVNRAALTAAVEVNLSGYVQYPESVVDDVRWHVQGDVLMKDISWARDGWQSKLDHVLLQGLQYDTGGYTYVQEMDVGRWTLMAPLTPLTEPNPITEPWQNFWLKDWSIQRMRLASGRFSIGWPDAVWMKLNAFAIAPLEPNKTITMQWQGQFLDGDLKADIHWQPWQKPTVLALKLRVQHALPFAINPWLLQSDIPDFIRGRFNMGIDLTSGLADGYSYNGSFDAELRHANLAQGMQKGDSFIRLTGLDPRVFLERVSVNETVSIHIPLQGNWENSPMNWGRIASDVLQNLAQKAKNSAAAAYPSPRKRSKILAYIRLHQENKLWPNERARLRQAIKILKKKPKLILELVPQLGRHTLDSQFILVTRRTQQLIEDYLRDRHISPDRIIPLWPQKAHEAGGEAGVRLQVYTPARPIPSLTQE